MSIGAHVSSAGGIIKALERGEAINADSLQLFISSPQSYKKTEYSEEIIEDFNRIFVEKGFKDLFFHCIYLLNLATLNEGLYHASIDSLIYYLTIGSAIKSKGTIVHLGSWGKTEEIDKPIQFERLVKGIKKVLDKSPRDQYFIVENTAAGGNRIGADLKELITINEAVSDERLKFCIDTQHLFASGIDVRDANMFNTWLEEFDKKIGIENLVCIHANDSKTELGSKADRHENIGEGKIGLEGFKNILNQPLLIDKTFILEIPGVDRKGPNKENIQILKNMVQMK